MARIDRINSELRSAISELLRSVKDPRVGGGLVSITRVVTAPDLKQAKVFFSVLGGDVASVRQGLKSASGWLRRELARTVILRQTPELHFVPDDSIQQGTHILELLHTIDIPEEMPENAAETTEEEDAL